MRVVLAIGAIGLALGGCVREAETDAAIDGVEANVPNTGRLGMRTDLTLEPSGLTGEQADWLTMTPNRADEVPPGGVGTSGQIDLNGDGKLETVRTQLGGAGWSEVAIFDSDRPDARELFRADGQALLVSKTRDVAGWPVLAMLVRDYDGPNPEAQKVTPDLTWTGAAYSDAEPVGPTEG